MVPDKKYNIIKYKFCQIFQKIACCLIIIFLWNMTCDQSCEEAKQWLTDNISGLKSNRTHTWNQLKFWISGNDENCLKYLLNGTDETSVDKIYEALRKDVFKDGDEALNKTEKNCSPRRKGTRRPNRKRRPNRRQGGGKNRQRNPATNFTKNGSPQNPGMNSTIRNVSVPPGRPKN